MVDLCHDRFAGQSTPIHIGTHREIDFRRDDRLIPFRKIVQRTAQNFFAPAIPVHVGCVKKVNAKHERSFNERPTLFLIQTPLSLLESVTHAAQTDSRHLESRLTKICIIHCFITSVSNYSLCRKRMSFRAKSRNLWLIRPKGPQTVRDVSTSLDMTTEG